MLKILGQGDDMWDPTTWIEEEYEHRIYADETLEIYAVVDEIDYPYLSQFKWSIHDYKKAERGLIYLRRSLHVNMGVSAGTYISPISGREVRDKKRIQ